MKIAENNPKLIQIWFMDESGFSVRVIRRKYWGKKGKRKRLAVERRRGRVNVMGFLRCSDKKRFVQFVKKEIQKHSMRSRKFFMNKQRKNG